MSKKQIRTKPRNIYLCAVKFAREVKIIPSGFTQYGFVYAAAKTDEEAKAKVLKHYTQHQISVEVTNAHLAIEQDESEYLSVIT